MNLNRENNNLVTDTGFKNATFPVRSIFESALTAAGKGLLSLARFSGLVVTTSVSDIEEGLKNGGEIEVKRSQELSSDPVNIPEWHLMNTLFSCFYLISRVEGELRETLHMIRIGMPGGAVLRFTDGELVGGIINAVNRIHFSSEEQQSARRMLFEVRNQVGEF
jgi:hypothetical protein